MAGDDVTDWPPRLSPAFKDFLAGGIGGMAGVVAGQPLDTVRIRLQQRSNKYAGTAQAWGSIVYKEGAKSLFKGMMYPLTTAAFQTAVTFYSYGAAMRMMNPTSDGHPSYSDIFACGIVAGAVQTFAVTPVDVLKIRLQVQTAVPGQESYIGALKMARQIAQRAGLQGLFRGISVTLWRDAPSHGVYFYVYHRTKDIIDSWERNEGSAAGGSSFGMFVAGGLAGAASWLSVYPLDVCKSRMQAEDRCRSPYRTWLDCAAQTYQQERAGAFWRGLTPTLFRGFLVNAAIFTSYESCIGILGA